MTPKTLTGLGIGACAAACAAGLLAPVLLVGGTAGFAAWMAGNGAIEIIACALPAVALLVAALLFYRRKKAAACAADKSCRCGSENQAAKV
jgi:hypothetical protein